MAPPEVEVFAWNAERPLPDAMGRLIRQPVNNFGDLLGPTIVSELLRRRGVAAQEARAPRRLLSVGSVMHFARDGDVVWGTGINGKVRRARLRRIDLDIRAVRGPLTARRLRRAGHNVPSVYGDPGSLVGTLWSREHFRRPALTSAALVVPNFNDLASVTVDASDAQLLDPRRPVDECLGAIASAEFVVASSLHGLIVAEAFGVPALRFRSPAEPDFKYEDYYQGTGRATHPCAETAEEALRVGTEAATEPTLDLTPLLDAFPWDLWGQPGSRR